MKQKEFEKKYIEYKKAYDNGTPLISDDEYDAFEAMGKELFPDSKVFSIVGIENDVKIKHKIPMMSLDKFREHEIDNLKKWAGTKRIVSSYKLDGCACSLIYKNGEFKQALSRGDGFYGQDITRAVNFCEGVPKKLFFNVRDEYTEIRGELIIFNEDFESLNKEMRKRGLDEANTRRNIIPGLISTTRKSDFDLAMFLTFKAYDCIGNFGTEMEKFNYLVELGFTTPFINLFRKDEIDSEIEKYKNNKENLHFATDGLVFTINDATDHIRDDKNPKWKKAFKIKNTVVSTVIKNILTEMTGSGRLSFVAEVKTVVLNEANVSKVTLHNIDYIHEHKINVGATIGITRSGDVIPKHEVTLIENGTYKTPKLCPVCGKKLEREGAYIICNNPNCEAKALGRLSKWVELIDAKGVSAKTIEGLYNANLIRHPKDLYTLKASEIERIPGFGKRSAELILEFINKGKIVSLEQIIRGANIPNIGESIAKMIVEEYKTMENFIKEGDYYSFIDTEGIGEEKAKLIESNKEVLFNFYKDMKTVVEIKSPVANESHASTLNGKSFCITGTLSKSRTKIEEEIVNAGGVISSVSKKLDYLVLGSDAGSKHDKAIKLGINIISENDLYKMIRG